MKYLKYLLIPILFSGCAAVMLKPADFSWPVENALKVNERGYISEERYTFNLNIKPIFMEEFNDPNLAIGKEIRIIRDVNGYYFITGSNFKNVYVLLPVEGGMKVEEKILISETEPILSPAFNQKSPNIELLDGSKKYLLNNKGIVR